MGSGPSEAAARASATRLCASWVDRAKPSSPVWPTCGILAGQFSLGITADLVPSEDPQKAKLLIDEVTATVGVHDLGDRVAFESIESTGPKPALTILQYEGTDLAYGTFSGDLSTRHSYSLDGAPSRQLHINIEANYTALKGQYTCAKR